MPTVISRLCHNSIFYQLKIKFQNVLKDTNAQNNNLSHLKSYQVIVEYTVLVLTGLGVILCIISYVYAYQQREKADYPLVGAIFGFVSNINDLLTDIMFSIILYVQNN